VLFVLRKRERSRACAVAETQSARSASRRAQFQLWIFSYTKLVASSKKRLSRVMMDFTNGFARICQRALWPFSTRKRTSYAHSEFWRS
jgi:hypothetical protein